MPPPAVLTQKSQDAEVMGAFQDSTAESQAIDKVRFCIADGVFDDCEVGLILICTMLCNVGCRRMRKR